MQLDPARELTTEAQRNFVRRWPGLVIPLIADPVNQGVGVVFPVQTLHVLEDGGNVGRKNTNRCSDGRLAV